MSEPELPKRVVSGAQIVRCCLVCVADIILADRYFCDGRPQLLLMRIDSVDNPNPKLTRIVGSDVNESQTAILAALEFLETNNKDPTDHVIGIYVDLRHETTRENFVFLDLRKFLPELFVGEVSVSREEKDLCHDNSVDIVLSRVSPVEQAIRWNSAAIFLTNSYYGEQSFVVCDAIGGSKQDLCTRGEVVDLCRENNFYVDQIRGLLEAEEVTGMVYRSGVDHTVVAFILFNVNNHMPVSNRKACAVQIHYALVRSDHRGCDLGTSLLNWTLDEAATKFPGCAVLIEVESKPTEGAMRFWFDKQNFQPDASPAGAPVPGLKTIIPSHLWSELGKVKKQNNDPEQFSTVGSLLFGDVED